MQSIPVQSGPQPITPSHLSSLHDTLTRRHAGRLTLNDTDGGYPDAPHAQRYTLTARMDGQVRVTVHGHGTYTLEEPEAGQWVARLEIDFNLSLEAWQ
ncbi:MAG: hypothetical protein HC933_08120 [Pleurocapsa sp. SU_196_0]|nr:hypothetical protein [Pleurocapsa sp. SU_196_0]